MTEYTIQYLLEHGELGEPVTVIGEIIDIQRKTQGRNKSGDWFLTKYKISAEGFNISIPIFTYDETGFHMGYKIGDLIRVENAKLGEFGDYKIKQLDINPQTSIEILSLVEEKREEQKQFIPDAEPDFLNMKKPDLVKWLEDNPNDGPATKRHVRRIIMFLARMDMDQMILDKLDEVIKCLNK